MKENVEKIRDHVLSLIDSDFESDAAFEREMGLPQKTVNNWRRCRSSSFMQMLPQLSELFDMNIGALLDIPPSQDSPELSDDELILLSLYRKTHTLPAEMRQALRQTLESTINMYLSVASGKGLQRKNKRQS